LRPSIFYCPPEKIRKKQMRNKKIVDETNEKGMGFLKSIAIDTVIFGFHENQLKVLLVEYKRTGLFALPGGFIREKENVNDAAVRVVSERTGLSNIFLEQFYLFGDYERFDPKSMKKILLANSISPSPKHWFLQRFISVGYYALVEFTRVTPAPQGIFDTCSWFDLSKMPVLIQDHEQIVKKALNALRTNLNEKLIGFNLLPDEFTMRDLQILYETILGKKLVRPAFQRKILRLEILQRLSTKKTGAAHKAPYLYRFASNQK
jgi:8-oxo-dGTP diphosphatase